MDTKSTPGNRKIVHFADDMVVVTQDNKLIGTFTGPDRDANAALYAAAPALADALRKTIVLARLVTVGQAIRDGDEAIEAAGLDPYCMREGLADGHEPIHLWEADAALAKIT